VASAAAADAAAESVLFNRVPRISCRRPAEVRSAAAAATRLRHHGVPGSSVGDCPRGNRIARRMKSNYGGHGRRRATNPISPAVRAKQNLSAGDCPG